MAIKIIYFVHGTTIDNEQHKAAGWNDVELSKKGIMQTLALRDEECINDIDLVITSDLKRAVDSAKNIFVDIKDMTIIQDCRIRECNYGNLNGQDSSLIKYEEHIEQAFPNGESLKDVEKRVRAFCNEIIKKYDGKTIAIVSHRAPQLALDVIIKKISWEEAIEKDWRKNKAWQPGWTLKIGTDSKF